MPPREKTTLSIQELMELDGIHVGLSREGESGKPFVMIVGRLPTSRMSFCITMKSKDALQMAEDLVEFAGLVDKEAFS